MTVPPTPADVDGGETNHRDRCGDGFFHVALVLLSNRDLNAERVKRFMGVGVGHRLRD